MPRIKNSITDKIRLDENELGQNDMTAANCIISKALKADQARLR